MGRKNIEYKRILIFNPYGIGDVLCTTPIIRDLRYRFPASYIAYMCNYRAAPIIRDNKFLNEVIIFEKSQTMQILKSSKLKFVKKMTGFFNSIRKKRFDLVIDLSINAQYGFFMKMAGIKERVGFDYKNRGKFLTKKIVLDSFSQRHIVENYLGVLELIGLKPQVHPLELFLTQNSLVEASKALKDKGLDEAKDFLVAICPGGGESWGKQAYMKHWLAERFAQIADTITEDLKVKVLIFAGPEETGIGRKVSGLVKNEVIDFSGETSLVGFAALLSKCRLLITNDGGPVHIGSALGLNTVSLFGPVDDVVYGPYPRTEKHSVIKKDLPCRPCYRKFRLPPCHNDRKCITLITPEEVIAEVKKQFKSISQNSSVPQVAVNKIPLSVVVLTKNEEKRIKDCLESISDWADEIIVIDDESQDKTIDIAKKYTDKIFIKRMDVEGSHRNWAYAKAKNDWVLSLDADERITLGLKIEITRELASNPEANAFTLPRKNFIGDYWVRWGGLYPAAQLKLFRKDKFKWEEVEVHPQAFLEGKCGHLKGDLIHYTYRDWGDFLKKLNSQTTLEAKKWYKLSLTDPKKVKYKMNLMHALWRTLDRFVRAFFVKKGFRDGFIGFMIAYFASLYQITSFVKYKELKKHAK